MTSRFYKDLVVVGFEGTVQSECGYAVAIARHQPTEEYIRLSFADAELELLDGSRPPGERVPPAPESYTAKGRLSVNDKSTIEAFRDDGDLTLFREDLKFPAVHNAIVLYVSQPLLDAAGLELRLQHTKLEELDWKLLSEEPYEVWVTCATLDSVFLLMDSWGWALMDKCSEHLVDYIASKGTDKNLLAKAQRCIEMALGAARKDALREELFLLYGVTVMYSAPEQVDDLFEMGFLTEFEGTSEIRTWPAFRQQLERRAETLSTRAKVKPTLPDPAAGGGAKDRGAAATPAPPPPGGDALKNKVEAAAQEIRRETRLPEKMAKAIEVAESCRRSFPPDEAVLNEIIAKLERGAEFINIGNEARFRVFASDPLFYLLTPDQRLNERDNLNVFEYIHLAADYWEAYQKNCGDTPLAACILKRAEIIPHQKAATFR